MAVRVVFDHPRHRDWRRLARGGSVVLVATLLVIGTRSLRTARPDVVERAVRLGDTISQLPTELFAVVFTMLLILPFLAISSWGLNPHRRRNQEGVSRRDLVLFLRRFRLPEAIQAVTFATSATLRHNWRLITLDDGSVAPIKASALMRATLRLLSVFYRTGEYVRRVFQPLRRCVTIYCKVVVYGAALILAIESAQARNFAPYAAVLERASSGRATLIEAVQFNLPGAFAALLVPGVTLVEWVAPYARAGWSLSEPFLPSAEWSVAIALLLILVYTAWGFSWIGLGSSWAWVRSPSYAGTFSIHKAESLDHTIREVKSATGKRSGPRLSIVTVDDAVWQLAVSRFVTEATVTVLDVSQPTEHILFEIEELTVRQRRPCIFIGHYDHVIRLTQDNSLGGFDQELARLLDGYRILAYTTDRSGLRHFARALRNALSDPALVR